MGINDRDWYKEGARERFRSSSDVKALRENKVRSKFAQYTHSISRGQRNQNGHNAVLTHVLLWLGLGALCFALFTWTSAPRVSVTGNQVEVVIPKAQDGHHYIDGILNGKPIRFLIDTGASYVSIGGNLAAQLGLFSGKPTKFETANGSVIGQLFENQSVKISGLTTPPLTVGVMPNSPNTALLGQNFLRHVELVQVDNTLILRGRNTGLLAPSPMTARAKTSMYAGIVLLLMAWLSSFLLQGSRR